MRAAARRPLRRTPEAGRIEAILARTVRESTHSNVRVPNRSRVSPYAVMTGRSDSTHAV